MIWVLTAPVLLLEDVPEGLKQWKDALGAIGGRPVEILALVFSAALFALGAFGPLILRRRENARKPVAEVRSESPAPPQRAGRSHEPTPTPPVLGDGEDRSPLKAALVRERANGKRLLPGLGVASPLTPQTTGEDVRAWEVTVRHLLRHNPDLLTIFDYDPPRDLFSDLESMSATSAISGGETAAQLRRRLAQLDKVIGGL